jgi:hypothetical protein
MKMLRTLLRKFHGDGVYEAETSRDEHDAASKSIALGQPAQVGSSDQRGAESFSLDNVLDDNFIAGRISPNRKHVWLVAAPKSGSTWLSELLADLLGWQTNRLVRWYHRREPEVELRAMLPYTDCNLFSHHQHCRFSDPTRAFIEQFRVRVVLQGRNLFDTVVSCRDHLLQEDLAIPMAYADRSFLDLSEERQLSFVVDLIVPWYLNFYGSWFAAKQSGEVDFHWVNYSDLRQDTRGTLQNILRSMGESRTEDQVSAAIDRVAKAPTRLNVGKNGRGAATLLPVHIERILQLRSYYPALDFSPIGL